MYLKNFLISVSISIFHCMEYALFHNGFQSRRSNSTLSNIECMLPSVFSLKRGSYARENIGIFKRLLPSVMNSMYYTCIPCTCVTKNSVRNSCVEQLHYYAARTFMAALFTPPLITRYTNSILIKKNHHTTPASLYISFLYMFLYHICRN